jgi:phosphatidylserine/phosphatidylglycerophosphate/cardiolipin synthase-like enzyme
MKYRALFIVFLLLLLAGTSSADQFQATGTVDVYFSPDGGCTDAIVREIDQAKKEILVQAYSFTSKPIAKALVDARKRGINIVVVLDKSQRTEKYSSADFLANSGLPTYIDSQHSIAHSKLILIDRTTLITGSFNFTKAAEYNNAENLLILKGNRSLVERYIRNFQEHKNHSEQYTGRQ